MARHASPLQSVRQRVVLQIAVTVWKWLYGVAPAYLQELCVPVDSVQGVLQLRSASTGCIQLPPLQTSIRLLRSFAFSGPSMWNSLPPAVYTTRSLDTFQQKLKTNLFGQWRTSPGTAVAFFAASVNTMSAMSGGRQGSCWPVFKKIARLVGRLGSGPPTPHRGRQGWCSVYPRPFFVSFGDVIQVFLLTYLWAYLLADVITPLFYSARHAFPSKFYLRSLHVMSYLVRNVSLAVIELWKYTHGENRNLVFLAMYFEKLNF